MKKELKNLPVEMKLLVFSYLKEKEQAEARLISKESNDLLQDKSIWRGNIRLHFPNAGKQQKKEYEDNPRDLYLTEYQQHLRYKKQGGWIFSMEQQLCSLRGDFSWLESDETLSTLGKLDILQKGEALKFAAVKGYHLLVQYLVKNAPDITDVNKANALIEAVTYGHLAIVKHLFENLPIMTDEDNSIGLEMATKNGHLEIVKYLIDKVQSFTPKDMHRGLNSAAKEGHLDVVNYFIENVQDINFDSKNKAINAANENKHFEVAMIIQESLGMNNNRNLTM